jgi:hypothetical protein
LRKLHFELSDPTRVIGIARWKRPEEMHMVWQHHRSQKMEGKFPLDGSHSFTQPPHGH